MDLKVGLSFPLLLVWILSAGASCPTGMTLIQKSTGQETCIAYESTAANSLDARRDCLTKYGSFSLLSLTDQQMVGSVAIPATGVLGYLDSVGVASGTDILIGLGRRSNWGWSHSQFPSFVDTTSRKFWWDYHEESPEFPLANEPFSGFWNGAAPSSAPEAAHGYVTFDSVADTLQASLGVVSPLPYICERPLPPLSCDSGWIFLGEHCYKPLDFEELFTNPPIYSYHMHRVQCDIWGGYVMSINSEVEQLFLEWYIKDNLPNWLDRLMYIGLTRNYKAEGSNIENFYSWEDGSILSDTGYFAWDTGFPSYSDGTTQNTLVAIKLWSNFLWTDVSFSYTRNHENAVSFCEKPAFLPSVSQNTCSENLLSASILNTITPSSTVSQSTIFWDPSTTIPATLKLDFSVPVYLRSISTSSVLPGLKLASYQVLIKETQFGASVPLKFFKTLSESSQTQNLAFTGHVGAAARSQEICPRRKAWSVTLSFEVHDDGDMTVVINGCSSPIRGSEFCRSWLETYDNFLTTSNFPGWGSSATNAPTSINLGVTSLYANDVGSVQAGQISLPSTSSVTSNYWLRIELAAERVMTGIITAVPSTFTSTPIVSFQLFWSRFNDPYPDEGPEVIPIVGYGNQLTQTSFCPPIPVRAVKIETGFQHKIVVSLLTAPVAHRTCFDCCNAGDCSCKCPLGYTGSQCETPPPITCSPACQNGGTCNSDRTCTCSSQWNGMDCGSASSFSSSSPSTFNCFQTCFNGGTCSSTDTCTCAAGYTGFNCLDATCSSTCLNGGMCTAPDQCTCAYGFDGADCSSPVCLQNCLNGGVCSAPSTCSCQASYTGSDCSEPICSPSCLNGGTCTSPNVCSCATGYGGSSCSDAVCSPTCANGGTCSAPDTCTCATGYSGNDCSTPLCSQTCSNGGTCSSPDTCTCAAGYSDNDCSQAVCTQNCANGGTCSAPDTCTCATGYTGHDCSTAVCSQNCSNGGTCSAPDTCTCASGYSSSDCSQAVCSQTCANGGICSAPDTCTCASGYTGLDCSSAVCSQICLNGGTCSAPDTCTCATGYSSSDCSQAVCSQTCANGGTCSAPDTCTCAFGYTDHDCSTPVCTQTCLNGGTCSSPDTCTCATGYSSSDCSEALCSPPCINGATCSAPNTCSCASGYTASDCSSPICSSNCLNGGTCVSPDTCLCSSGYTGNDCSLPICSLACANGGLCTAPDQCTCTSGYTGVNCADAVCTQLCQNGGSCSAPDTCDCANGYTGNDCSAAICSQTCSNGGTCSAPDTCTCASGYSSSDCSQAVCSQTCANGATCSAPDTCTCAFGYTDHDCSTPVCTQRCLNGGTCSSPDTCTCATGFSDSDCSQAICSQLCSNGGTCSAPDTCTCANGYTGNNCLSAICSQTCLNGGQCTAPDTCTCSPSYTGSNCSEPICSPQCQNAGQCISPGTCSCTAGWTGSDCSQAICSQACVNGAVCVAPETCDCAPGYTGNQCDEPICSRGCVNGGTCDSPEVCWCPTGYNGSDCSSVICTEVCQNGATCSSPDVCTCATGYSGTACSEAICSLGCINGGTCFTPEMCTCSTGYTGIDCSEAICSQTCLNGGSCVSPDTCSCSNGFAGHDCSKKACFDRPVVGNAECSAERNATFLEGTNVTFVCPFGYIYPDGSVEQKVTCSAGQWSAFHPQCQFEKPGSLYLVGLYSPSALLLLHDDLTEMVEVKSSLLTESVESISWQEAQESVDLIFDSFDQVSTMGAEIDTETTRQLANSYTNALGSLGSALSTKGTNDSADDVEEVKQLIGELKKLSCEERAIAVADIIKDRTALSKNQSQILYRILLQFSEIMTGLALQTLETGESLTADGDFLSLTIVPTEIGNLPGLFVDNSLASVQFPDRNQLEPEPLLQETLPSSAGVVVALVAFVKNVYNVDQPFNAPTISMAVLDRQGQPLTLNPAVALVQTAKPQESKASVFLLNTFVAQCDVTEIICSEENATSIATQANFPMDSENGTFLLTIGPTSVHYEVYIGFNRVPSKLDANYSISVTNDFARTSKLTESQPDIDLFFERSTGLRLGFSSAAVSQLLSARTGNMTVVARKLFNETGKLPADACQLMEVLAFQLQVKDAKNSTSAQRRKRSSVLEKSLDILSSSSQKVIEFKSNYFGNLGVELLIAPNTIQFAEILANFSTLVADNWGVLAFMSGCAFCFLMGVAVFWWYDRDDIKQWAYLPLRDNLQVARYCYYVSISNHGIKNYDPTQVIQLKLRGEVDETGWRWLQDWERPNFKIGHPENLILATNYSLGENLQLDLRMLADDKCSMSLVIDDVIVMEPMADRKFHFRISQRLKADSQVYHFQIADDDETHEFAYLVKKRVRVDMSEHHPWFSMLSRPIPSNWTRVERLACVTSGVFLAMLVNCMFYGQEPVSASSEGISLGPIRLTWFSLYTSVASCLIVIPPTLCMSLIFKRIQRLSPSKRNRLTIFQITASLNRQQPKPKRQFLLPYWFAFVGWFLVFACIGLSSFLIVMYSLQWGREKSLEWLGGMFLHVLQDVLLIQTIQVGLLMVFSSVLLKKPDDGTSRHLQSVKPSRNRTEKTELFKRSRLVIGGLVHNLLYVISFGLLIGLTVNRQSFQQIDALRPLCSVPLKKLASEQTVVYQEQIFNFLQQQLLPNLLNGNQLHYSESERRQKMMKNSDVYLLGPVRLRQQRFAKMNCPIATALNGTFFIRQTHLPSEAVDRLLTNLTDCRTELETDTERRSFNQSWDRQIEARNLSETDPVLGAWMHQALEGHSFYGRHLSYTPNGYIKDLSRNSSEQAVAEVELLKQLGWIDEFTAAMIAEFTVFNAQVNLFVPVKVVFEALEGGGYVFHSRLYALQLYQYIGSNAILAFIVQGLWIVLNLTHLLKLLYSTCKHGCKFFGNGWNVLELFTASTSLLILVVYAIRFPIIFDAIGQFKVQKDQFVNLDLLAFLDDVFLSLMGFCFMLNIFLFFRHLSFNKQWSIFVGTLSIGKIDIFSYLAIYSFLTISFAAWGFLMLGENDRYFQSIGRGTLILMYNVVGFNKRLLARSDLSNLAIVFYASYASLVFFLGIQTFMAVINQCYAFVSCNVEAATGWDRPLAQYLARGVAKLLGFKRRSDQEKAPDQPGKEQLGANVTDWQQLGGRIEQMQERIDQTTLSMFRDSTDALLDAVIQHGGWLREMQESKATNRKTAKGCHNDSSNPISDAEHDALTLLNMQKRPSCYPES